MTDSPNGMETQEYDEVPEEVVETSFMCGECFLLFPTTEDFNSHQCQVSEVEVEDVPSKGKEKQQTSPAALDVPQSTECVQIGVWETGESEAAMKEAVASILGERMKRPAPRESPTPEVQLDHSIAGEGGSMKLTSTMEHHMNPILEHTVEDTDHLEGGSMQMEAIEIPTTNLYMFDNPVYLNRLMKDNTFGRRVRHDAPYSHRLGPWDNKSSRLLIQLLREYPRAYFILDKECKRTEAWEIIRMRLAEAGYQFTVLQIRMRWRELCKKYRNTVNHNDLYNTRKTCQFFDDLNDLFGVWDHQATLVLIKQLEANGGKPLGQNGGTRMRIKVWEHIRQVLAKHSYEYTPDQVQGRWSNLVTLYQRMVEHNSKPHNEPITIAFKDHIERIFNYVPERNSKWLKIMEKRGKTPKSSTKKWTLQVERKLLSYYLARAYRFNNDLVDNHTLWKEIVQKLEEEDEYSTTVEKVRTRFYELTKQFSITEQHNSQPGTIRRECKHHDMLAEIYNIYNFWPHDRSTIKMDKTNTIRMRQVNAQLTWSEDQSRTLLQLYPQTLVAHLTSGDHQPIEELWLQLAKAYMNAISDRKQCYEIEEHIALLRRGYHSQNPFPFVTEMQLVEETESTFGFVQDALPIRSDQLVLYWSHRAAHLLLDFIIHHRQEGVKNSSLFEMISRDLAGYGYRYTGEECRVYYSLLRQLYTNRMRTIRRNKELIKPFPYMDKMSEVDAVVSQPRFVETPENRLTVLCAATSKLDEVKNEDDEVKRDHLVTWLTNLKMFLKHSKTVNPPPSVKCLARILTDAVEDPSLDIKFKECCTILGPHLGLLKSISERGGSCTEFSLSSCRTKGQKLTTKNFVPKYGNVQWTKKNLLTMLRTIKEWKLLCHDNAEVELMIGSGQPLWREVASRLGDHYKVDPNKCQERFTQLCREYKSIVSFNARVGSAEGSKSVVCQELIEDIMSPIIHHEAKLDVRDIWWASGEGGDWSQHETSNLIFTVRELWSGSLMLNWDGVSMLMTSNGYKRDAKSCQERFEHLFRGYQLAVEHNQMCSLRTRRRPPFYYKLKALFGDFEGNFTDETEPTIRQELSIDKTQILPVIVPELKKLKGHHCHSVPRRPLLLALAQHLNEYFQCIPSFTSYNVWDLLHHLHHIHHKAAEKKIEIPDEVNLGELWQNDPCALVAYGLHATPLPGWQQVYNWDIKEIYILVEAVVSWVLQQQSLDQTGKSVEEVAIELLKAHGYDKTTSQCQEQWQYVVTVFRQGGYSQFGDQMNLIFVLAPSLLTPNLNDRSMVSVKNYLQQQVLYSKNKLTITSPLKSKNVTVRHASKKVKTEIQDTTVHTVTADELDGSITNDATHSIASYVQINLPKCTNQKKCDVQVSTDELRDNVKGASSCETEKECDVSTDIKSAFTTPLLRTPKEFTLTSGLKNNREIGKIKKSSFLTTEIKSAVFKPLENVYGTYSDKSHGNKVEVEVVSITEKGSVKQIECRTMPGITPVRIIKLHYPTDYPIPSSARHMYVPWAMIHPDTMSASVKEPSFRISDVKGRSDCTTPSPNMPCILKVKCNGKSEEERVCEEKRIDLNVTVPSNIGKNSNTEEEDVLRLLSQYSQQCMLEKNRLFNILQESHQQQTSALKQVLEAFKELHESL